MSRWFRKPHKPAWLLGVLNCTPDSFSDGNTDNLEALILRAKEMVKQGADIIDVGGESTRPNAQPVSLEEELNRVLPVVKALVALNIPVSIDTMKAEVILQATQAGAILVNDVSSLTHDEKSLQVVAETGVDVCLMHMKGNPRTMQNKPKYKDVLSEVICFFEQRVEVCLAAGVQKTSMILDPGIGFGKRLEDNLQLIANLNLIKRHFSMPIMLGTSRKSFLGLMTGADLAQREVETAVSSAIGIFCGADIIRIHDCGLQKKTAIVAAQLHDYRHEDAYAH